MKLQLYMWSGQRQMILEKHDFYVHQIKARVLAQFHDVAAQADRYLNAEYERLGSLPAREDIDMSDIAEAALERGQTFYSLLSDLGKRMLLGALAGIYHEWEKDLRDFIEHELRHDLKPSAVMSCAWHGHIGKVFDLLEEFGWNCRSCSFFLRIDACRLVVNVFKHGKGLALNQLAERFPEYLETGFSGDQFTAGFVDHEWLSISEDQFDEISNAVRQFWVEFPERLFIGVKPGF